MSSSNASLARFEPLRSIAFGSISGTYAAIGTAFAFAARVLIINNLTNANITISFDGINDHLAIASSTSMILDVCSDRGSNANILVIPAGTVVYVKQTSGAPTSGSVYVSVMYAQSF
jgi:hypothetical protein